MITVQFANGKTYQVENIDEAIAKCLANGDDPFRPIIVETPIETKTCNPTIHKIHNLIPTKVHFEL